MAGLTEHVVVRGYQQDERERFERRGPSAAERHDVAQDRARRRLAALVRTVEADIIPRLVLSRRARPNGPDAPAAPDPAGAREREVAHLSALVLDDDADEAVSYVGGLRARGVPVESLYLDILAPTARHLGELWDADLCDFTQVTVGLWKLHEVLRSLAPALRDEPAPLAHGGRRILLAPASGEQHTFGLLMVAEFLRRAGWDVWCGPPEPGDDLRAMVRRESFAIIGLSASCDACMQTLAGTIRGVRRASRNRAAGIMVGGPAFVERPELAPLVGADATATDGRQAALQAENLLALLTTRR